MVCLVVLWLIVSALAGVTAGYLLALTQGQAGCVRVARGLRVCLVTARGNVLAL